MRRENGYGLRILAGGMLVAAALGLAAFTPPSRASATSALVAATPVAAGLAAPAGATEMASEGAPPSLAAAGEVAPSLVFAVIGDYGMGNPNEGAVASLVESWKPAFVVTTGDDYYRPAGGEGPDRYENSTGRYFRRWLTGTKAAFFPSLGNHDYTEAGLDNYLAYFNLPGPGLTSTSGNERYYDFVWGPLHFYVLNSNSQEPDGITATSKQAEWLQRGLAGSKARWNVVVDHHPPYSSDEFHGNTPALQWPFGPWGAKVMLSGHAHTYERVEQGGVTYFVNGLGSARRYRFNAPVPGSLVRYSDNFGAQRATVQGDQLVFEFYDVTGKRIDRAGIPARR